MHKIVNNLIEIENQLKDLGENNLEKGVKIIAVSKTFPLTNIMPLINHYHVHFGENKIQEATEKWTDVKNDFPNIKLHMLGKIQTNKVKYLLPLFDFVHSLDNLKLAKKIASEEKKKNKKLKIFIQVNIGNEDQKNGVEIKNLENFYKECTEVLNLNIIGLMCLPPQLSNPDKHFMVLNEYAKKLNLYELSMGMSGDYTSAVKCGSTYIRVGSKIFGSRN